MSTAVSVSNPSCACCRWLEGLSDDSNISIILARPIGEGLVCCSASVLTCVLRRPEANLQDTPTPSPTPPLFLHRPCISLVLFFREFTSLLLGREPGTCQSKAGCYCGDGTSPHNPCALNQQKERLRAVHCAVPPPPLQLLFSFSSSTSRVSLDVYFALATQLSESCRHTAPLFRACSSSSRDLGWTPRDIA